MDHKWHVHVNPEGNDTYAEMGPRCKSLGGHYNPYLVDLAVSIMRLRCQFARKKSYFKEKIVHVVDVRHETNTACKAQRKAYFQLVIFDPVLMTLFIGLRLFRTFPFIFMSIA